MSSRVILDVKDVKCNNDHGYGTPCDGHTIKLVHHLTSDTVNLEIDEWSHTFDDRIWGAIVRAEEQYTEYNDRIEQELKQAREK